LYHLSAPSVCHEFFYSKIAWKKKIGLPLFLTKIINIINILIKINFNGRIVDAVAAESLRKIHMFRKHFDYVKIEEYD